MKTPHQLSMADFEHLSEEQLNSLTTGANFLFSPPHENPQAPQVNPGGKKPSKVFGKTPAS